MSIDNGSVVAAVTYEEEGSFERIFRRMTGGKIRSL